MSKRAGPGALLSLGSRVGAWDFTGSGFTGEFKTEEQELKAQREKTSGPSRQSLKSTRVSKAKGPGWGSGHVFMRDAPYPRCPEVDALQSQPVRHLLYKKKNRGWASGTEITCRVIREVCPRRVFMFSRYLSSVRQGLHGS